MQVTPWYIGSDMLLFVNKVKDRDGSFVNDGVVAYTVISKYPINGSFQTFDTGTLPNVDDGRYEKVIDATVTSQVALGQRVIITIILSNVESNDREWKFEGYGVYA